MSGFLDIIIEDARRGGLDGAIPDIERMRDASLQLASQVERLGAALSENIGSQGDFMAYQARLRHDLRTPLNAIKGYGELLMEDLQGSDAPILADLHSLAASAERLIEQIDSLSALASPEPGPALSEMQRHSIRMAADLLRSVRPVSSAAPDRRSAPKGSILIADDNASNRDLLRRRLTREGHRVVTAEDGPSALAIMAREELDLALLDLMMPGMTGIEVLQRLKADERTRDVPVIVISAFDELDSVVRCIEAGAEDYLTKPFNPILLRARIEASLEKKALRDREQGHLEALTAEKQRSEALLLNLLPATIVERMRRGETVIADRFAEVSILFCDIVGFTPIAASLAPGRTVELLSRVFSAFDAAVAERGLEKIKTIGDAYMVAGGLPEAQHDHAPRVAELALAMLDIVKRAGAELGFDLSVRIGIHSGEAVAGILGTHKLIYDVWGDTVNTACRMEAHGVADSIHISDDTRRLLAGVFAVEPRGEIEVRGKGRMRTFFLLGPAP